MAVAREAKDAERHLVPIAGGVQEEQRKVAIDAVPDGVMLGAHADGFGDGELAVLGQRDVGIEGMDDFRRQRWRRAHARKRKRRNKRTQQQHAEARAHGAGARLTCGTAPSPSPSWKNSRGAKPNRPAIRLLGNDCTITLRLRTVPL